MADLYLWRAGVGVVGVELPALIGQAVRLIVALDGHMRGNLDLVYSG